MAIAGVVEALTGPAPSRGSPRFPDHLLELGQDRGRSLDPEEGAGAASLPPSSAVGIVWMGWMEPKRTPALSFRTEAGWAPERWIRVCRASGPLA